jgi:hypothetical protein
MAEKLPHEELIKRLGTPGWRLVTDNKDEPDEGTLQEVLETSHDRAQRNEHPGLVRQIETSIELDMLQIERLWLYMGLPMI